MYCAKKGQESNRMGHKCDVGTSGTTTDDINDRKEDGRI